MLLRSVSAPSSPRARASRRFSPAAACGLLVAWALLGSACYRAAEVAMVAEPIETEAPQAGGDSLERFLTPPMSPGALREFTNREGKTFRGRLLEVNANQVVIAREDGRRFQTGPGLYCDADQAFFRRAKIDHLVRHSSLYKSISAADRGKMNKRVYIQTTLDSKTAFGTQIKAQLARNGTAVGCRTVLVPRKYFDFDAALDRDIADIQAVLASPAGLDEPGR